MSDPRSDVDKLSDLLKASTVRRHIQEQQLPEEEIAALFVNERDGPQFFVGDRGRAQPLYFTQARHWQEPVAWIALKANRLITMDRSAYRDDIEWTPLYLAR